MASDHPPADGDFRILFISMEFTCAPFSGNGSIVKSLLRASSSSDPDSRPRHCSVRVVCARPHPSLPGLSANNPLAPPEISEAESDALEVWAVDLPPGSVWRRLDRASAWEDFAAGAALSCASRAAGWCPGAVLVVDWHGAAAWGAMLASWPEDAARPPPPGLCYFNFRVYSSGLSNCGAISDVKGRYDHEWYEQRERDALQLASDVICLSSGDRDSLSRLLPPEKVGNVEVRLLHPALRGDMRDLALRTEDDILRQHLHPAARTVLGDDGDGVRRRRFVTCAVRLSEEKNPLLFARLMENESLQETMADRGLVPLLCGSTSDRAYGAKCRQRLSAAVPGAVVIEDFLGPRELAAVFSWTLINVHPCCYDAYGMTAVEAAAFGAPSVINGGDTVGATELLGKEGCFQVDMTQPVEDLAKVISNIVTDDERMVGVRRAAFDAAMAWTEDVSGRFILDLLQGHDSLLN